MDVQEWSAIAANMATIFGIPLALVVWLREKKRERQEREYGTYNALDESYLMYLDRTREMRELQWRGWDAYIRGMAKREVFQTLWQARGHDDHAAFLEYMTRVMRDAGADTSNDISLRQLQ